VISVVNQLEARLEDIITPVDVAVIGCIVNGPGEAKVAEIGLTGASPSNLVYVEGKPHHKIDNNKLVDELEIMVRERVAQKLAAQQARLAARHPDIIATD
jgi:(E)-4-hydroxy-3-methylbut-2-enyl-diphosphate synthase